MCLRGGQGCRRQNRCLSYRSSRCTHGLLYKPVVERAREQGQLGAARKYYCKRHQNVMVRSQNGDGKGGGLGDDLLDFMYAGKKLRKWYGQEGQVLPQSPVEAMEDELYMLEDDEVDANVHRDNVLVLDSETSIMAEQTLLQLILLRFPTKIMVKDPIGAKSSYGTYVEVFKGNFKDLDGVKRSLRSVQTVVCCSIVTKQMLQVLKSGGVEHIVLLSLVGSRAPSGFAALFGNQETAILRDAQRETNVVESGMKYTIVRVKGLSDDPGGMSKLEISRILDYRASEIVETLENGKDAPVAREDAALVLAQMASRLQHCTDRNESGMSLHLSLGNLGPGRPPGNWQTIFDSISS